MESKLEEIRLDYKSDSSYPKININNNPEKIDCCSNNNIKLATQVINGAKVEPEEKNNNCEEKQSIKTNSKFTSEGICNLSTYRSSIRITSSVSEIYISKVIRLDFLLLTLQYLSLIDLLRIRLVKKKICPGCRKNGIVANSGSKYV